MLYEPSPGDHSLKMSLECMWDGSLQFGGGAVSLLIEVDPDRGGGHAVSGDSQVVVRDRQLLLLWVQQVIQLHHRQELTQLGDGEK